MMLSYSITPIIEKARITKALALGKRTDDRNLKEFRNIKITTGYVKKAEGSAYVELGNTKVLAGVKVSVGTPFPDTPNQGLFIVNTEFVPAASPLFEPGPPDEYSIEVARVVDRGIRHAEAIDLESLCIVPGEKVYTVFIDVYVLDHDGNLFDASALAVMAALLTTEIPKAEVDDDGNVKFKNERMPLPIKNRMVSLTWAKINNYLVLDPTSVEENVMDARITIAIDADGYLVGIQKGESGYLTLEEISQAVNDSIEISKVLLEKLPGGKSNGQD